MTPPPAFAWRKGHVATRPNGRGDKKIRAFSSPLQSGQSVACKGIAQLKKLKTHSTFAIYSSKKVKRHQYWAAA